MKKLFFLSLSTMMMMSVISCSTETTDEIPNEKIIENVEDWDHIQLSITDSSKQLGKYNALGYGYNVLGEYANENSTTLKIIDTDKFKSEHHQRLSEENVLSHEYTENYGEDAAAYLKMISKKVSATQQFRVYGKTIPFSSAILSNKKYDPRFIYGNYNYIVKQKRFRLNESNELLSNYLTSNFSKDLEEKTAEQIVQKYGTHVAVDIYTGSIIDMIFQAKTTNSDRENAARIGVKTVAGTDNEIDTQSASKNYEKKLFYKTRGGDKSLAIAGIFNLEKITPTINFYNWQSTSTMENAVLVDFGDNGLIFLYDLVKDPAKKAELKLYIDQYINKNQVVLGS
ncbi:MAC/perforin domain-containing protein [Chryseobacterium sp. 18068]|uniref:MAC/perforin domain-containing protein n=1 Tax=Chryseobacterium sp. 18068 TaxID=2681414 RepID=UPI00135794A6|nr:MAC/perforin domain-containing protein [Chryseobacterium sp. 18068]